MVSTARSNASVLTARPSPTAPKSVRLYAVGRSRGAGRGGGGGADRSLRNPPPAAPPAPALPKDIEALCHRNTSANPTTHAAASSALFAATKATAPRRWCSLPPPVSTIAPRGPCVSPAGSGGAAGLRSPEISRPRSDAATAWDQSVAQGACSRGKAGRGGEGSVWEGENFRHGKLVRRFL